MCVGVCVLVQKSVELCVVSWHSSSGRDCHQGNGQTHCSFVSVCVKERERESERRVSKLV